MKEILDYKSLETLVNEVFWITVPGRQNVSFKGNLKDDLGIDSLDLLDLASEFHFRFDMLSGSTDAYLLQYNTAELWMEQIYMAANDPKKRFGFFSSGSIGKPKHIWHSKQMLLKERDFWLELTNAKGILCLAPVRHIYGFIWGLLIGSKLKRAQFLKINHWHELAERANTNDLIIGHPSAWQQIRTPFPHQLAISSTAPIEKNLTNRLQKEGVKGMNIYGSTETAAIGWQNWNEDYFQLLPYWSKHKKGVTHSGENFEIPDDLHWINEQQFEIIGRKDAVIQIGGQNVSLTEVRNQLKEIIGVKEVWVKSFYNNLGLRIYSYFQLKPEINKDQFERDLPAILQKLPTIMKPRKWDISHSPFNKLKQS